MMTTSGPARFACNLGALVGPGLSTIAHTAVAGARPPSVKGVFPISLRDHSCERESSIHASRNVGGPRAWLMIRSAATMARPATSAVMALTARLVSFRLSWGNKFQTRRFVYDHHREIPCVSF